MIICELNSKQDVTMETYFGINYEFDRQIIHQNIDNRLSQRMSAYICVADGVVLNTAHRNPEYLKVVNGSLFSLCDSSYVPLYLKWIYGIKRGQYCGSEIFMDIVNKKKYHMFFLGASNEVLQGLKQRLSRIDERIEQMNFYELPYCDVNDFDYPGIAGQIEKDGAGIIWVALGAPKQEIFMHKLQPYLKQGVIIAVGAVFNFFSGTGIKRAPQWMVKMHLEFVFRIFCEPKKQVSRCFWIIYMLPKLFWAELRKKKNINI
jgi:N-acetylglucosaminyldiphosphoundecaprenol N-acetyl-beta-D-mannosaminyltransferase